MSRMRARPPIGGLSVAVFAVLMAGSLTAAFYGRQVARDQEKRLLTQRAGEAAALITNLMNQSQASSRSLAAVVAATHGDPAAFDSTAKGDPTVTKAQGAVALVQP